MSAGAPIDEILFRVSPGEIFAALLSQGRLVELLIEREEARSRVGDVHLGRVGKVLASLGGAFVEISAERAGFLPLDEAKTALDHRGAAVALPKGPSEGAALLVQVTKDGFGEKGPRLSTLLSLPGRWLVLTPMRPGVSISRRIAQGEERARLEAALAPQLSDGEGVILRTAAAGIDPAALQADLASLRAAWRSLLDRAPGAKPPALLHQEPGLVERVLRDHGGAALRCVVCDDRASLERIRAELAAAGRNVDCLLERDGEAIFARHDVEAQIAAALDPAVELPSGGRLVFGALEALTAIDVDMARSAGGARFEDAVLAVNLEAAREIARQIRLRDIAGLIVIDFVHMAKPAHRARVTEALRAAFDADPIQVQLGGMTPMGLFEMTRKRSRESLRDQLTAPCDACHGGGRLKSAETVGYEILRAAAREAAASPGKALTVIAAPSVVAVLEGELAAARQELEARLGRQLALRADPAYGRERFDIVTT